MQRLIREISKDLVRVFQSVSLGAFHEAAEVYLVDLLWTQICVIHASRHLLGQKDLERTA